MLEKETQKHIRREFIMDVIRIQFHRIQYFRFGVRVFYCRVGFLKRESEHEFGFFPSPGFLWVRVQVRVRVRSGFRSMPLTSWNVFTFVLAGNSTPIYICLRVSQQDFPGGI